MPLNLSRAGDEPANNVHVKVLVCGAFGAGKTHALARAGRPGRKVALLLCEANGYPAVRRSNPDALVVHAYEPARYPGCRTSVDVVRQFLADATSGAFAAAGVGALAVDSLHEVLRYMRDEMTAGRDASTEFSLREWGELNERGRRFFRALNATAYDVVASVGVDTEKNEATGEVQFVPMLPGRQLPREVGGYFTAVGYLFKREVGEGDQRRIERRVLFEGPSRFPCKWAAPLSHLEQPEPGDWFARIAAELGATGPTATASGPSLPASDPPTNGGAAGNGTSTGAKKRRRFGTGSGGESAADLTAPDTSITSTPTE